MNIAQFLFKRCSLESEYAKEGELLGSDSNEDTSNWVARVGRKKAAGEEEATHKGEHTEEQNTQPATGSRKQNAKRRQLKRREHNTQGGTQHRRRNMMRNTTQKEEQNTEGGT